MEFNEFNFNPREGFINNDFYEDTPENSREILQRQHNQTRDFINYIIKILNSSVKGESGSEYIKSPLIPGVTGDNIYAQIENIKSQINGISLNSVPDGSITENKLAKNAVTNKNIKDFEITSDKLAKDIIVNKAYDSLNLNGKKSSLYEPLSTTGDIDILKENIIDLNVRFLKGANKNNSYYFFDNNILKKLNLDSFILKELYNTNSDGKRKIAVNDDGEIIYTEEFEENGFFYVKIYSFNEKFTTPTLLSKIKLFSASKWVAEVIGLGIFNDNLYIATHHHWDRETEIYIYKVALKDIKDTISLTPIHSYFTLPVPYTFIVDKGRAYIGNKVFSNLLFNEYKIIDGNIVSLDFDNILVTGSQFNILSKEDLKPKIASTAKKDVENAFLDRNYLYRVIGGYLFRTKLF